MNMPQLKRQTVSASQSEAPLSPDKPAYPPSSPPHYPSSLVHSCARSHSSTGMVPAAGGASNSIFIPSSPPVVVASLKKALSSSHLSIDSRHAPLDHDDLSENEDILYAMGTSSRNGLRTRPLGVGASKPKQKDRLISTGHQKGAGETETELDEPPRHLPTSRKISSPPPLAPPTPLARVTPLLFQTFRLLSIVPAIVGAGYHLYNICYLQTTHSRLDHFVCFLWALLTAHQCLMLTTGLLIRWKAYYPPLPTLIRLLALQAICWPATQFTLVLFNHERRPVICWAIIGSTTCFSRSIQIWVTSNLWGPGFGQGAEGTGVKWGARRWDWNKVGLRCVLPMGVVYFAMAWAEALRRELSGC